jgi:hypothetical protein
MTLSAMASHPSVRAEIKNPWKQLASDEIVAGIIMLAIITMIVVTVWTTVRLLPEGLPPYYLAYRSAYDYYDGLEYCATLNRHTITWPLRPQPCGCSCC